MTKPTPVAFSALCLVLAASTLARGQSPLAAPETPGKPPTTGLQAGAKSSGTIPISITNGHLRLDFSRNGNQVTFERMVKLSGGGHVFANDTPPGRLWEVGLRQLPVPQGAGAFPTVAKVYPTDCFGSVTHKTAVTGGTTALEFRWPNCRPVAGDPGNSFDLTLRIEMDAGDPVTRWTFEVENHLPGWALYYASLIHGFADETQDTFLVVPATGRLVRNPHANLAPNPTATGANGLPFTNWQHFQLFPYYTADGHGAYYATHDGKATHAKFTNLFGYGNRYEVQSACYPENSSVTAAGTSWTQPYPIAMGVFDGDWYDAAQIYRAWAETQPILEKGKLLTRTDIPAWMKDLIVANIGYLPTPLTSPVAVANYVAKWIEIRDYQGLQNEDYFVFHAGWAEPDSTGYYQPLPGVGALFQALRAQDIYTGSRYLSFAYGVNAPASPCGNAQASAATLVNGTLDPFDWNGGVHVNPYTPFALCHLNDFVANRLLPTGAVHFFYDNPYFGDVSYDPAHGNPLGQGGSWLYDAVASTMEQVRIAGRALDPKFVTTHEASFEAYIRAADSTGAAYAFFNPFFVNPGAVAEELRIPLQSTLYHDYTILPAGIELADYYNLTGTYTVYEDIHFVAAYGFDEGRRMDPVEPYLPVGYANHEILEPGSPLAATAPAVAQTVFNYTLFLNTLIGVRKTDYGRKYLIYGRRLRPLALAGVPIVSKYFNPVFMGASPTFPVTAPEVLASVWEASDGSGDVGIVLTNYNDAPKSFTLDFGAAAYGLDPAASHDLVRLEPTGASPVLTFTASFSLPVTMPPKSVRVYQVE